MNKFSLALILILVSSASQAMETTGWCAPEFDSCGDESDSIFGSGGGGGGGGGGADTLAGCRDGVDLNIARSGKDVAIRCETSGGAAYPDSNNGWLQGFECIINGVSDYTSLGTPQACYDSCSVNSNC
ncbi:hypothetical protein [Methylomonas sp. AM2-LC]|uniref:hypothetical protein n=1 Tax=Methylomonas sp. AM2-LC TaxID=3153301 RepID=UPI003262DCD4